MPCPHNEITIVQRSQRQSAVAAAAYQSGEKLFCEYDQQVKHYPEKRGIVHNEILLPANAPQEYADRNTLWNAAEAVEKQWNSQLARRWVLTIPREIPPDQYAVLVREFCQKQFVSKGMIADFAIHDPHPPGHNPHAHVLLTMRAMDEHGKWLPKSRKVYDLDENGERIKLPSGRLKSHKEDTVDWNNQKYCEIWRHEWEVIQNRYLEANDRPERVDLRSYARQGLDIVPTVHEGAAVRQMEKRGIQTNIGNLNREIRAANNLMKSIRQLIQRLLYEQIDEITEGIAEVQASGGERFTVKQLERTRKSLEARLEKLQAEGRKDDVVTFEQLGVDRLFVDEAHNYKNLFLYTKMRNVAGLSTSDAQKSSDMFAKCRYMDEITGNRGVIFATGTPVSNSMTELYTMQRYLQYERLQELNMTHFDCWASRFGETVTALELAPEGTGYRARTRFSKFFNLPELMNLFKEVADIKTADQLNLPTPEVEYHNIVAQPTEHQQEMVKALSERASLVHSGTVDPSQDNMLKITSDGRKLGLDQRIVNQMLPDEPGTKVNQCVDNIMQIWRDGKADKLTQLVFCDISTPQAKAPASKAAKTLDNPLLQALEGAVPLPEQEPVFTVYDDIRQKLIAQGMPADQIAFIHEANTEVRKKELFSKVRTGQVRVLLGSTAKMGAGTNVQDRLVALHDLDCPWRPGDLAQRKGRIERQGNQNPLVHVYRYVTEGTFDAYLWQTVENKQKFISQIMTSKSPVRSCDDVDETALSFAEIKALCAGDPRIKERMDLDVEVSRLKLMKADHQSKQYRLEDQLLKYFPEEIEKHKGFIKGFESDLEVLAAHPHPEDGFAGMEIRGDLLTDKENAGAALLDACKEVKTSDPVQIGNYRGYAMSVEFSAWKQEYTLLLKGQMTHRATLGTDPRGNLTRIDNALAQMPQRLEAAKAQLDNLYQQQAAAKEEVGKPFLYEEELRSKNARLVELDTLLNIDGKGQAHTESVVAKSTRPSVLDNLKRPVQPRSTDKKPKQHEEVR
ncbi:hypothetical protein DW923_00585 [Butyricicoccus sp. AM42-5AC]|nr:hypothetical protein DW923_00585 [Butyricicoccus sp. AM42-5AC]